MKAEEFYNKEENYLPLHMMDVWDLYELMEEYASIKRKELEEGKRQSLIDFQNFLILDGQILIDNDEVKKNAEIFLTSKTK